MATTLTPPQHVERYKVPTSRLIPDLSGAIGEDAQGMGTVAKYNQAKTDDDESLPATHTLSDIQDLDLEAKAFHAHFDYLTHQRMDKLNNYICSEETAYRKLQHVLHETDEAKVNESDDGEVPTGPRMQRQQTHEQLPDDEDVDEEEGEGEEDYTKRRRRDIAYVDEE